MTRGIVYCFTNKLNNKKYIGKTINEYDRLRRHCKNVGIEKTPLYNAINKYGWINFDYTVLYEIHGEDKIEVDKLIQEKEISLISELDTIKNGYNLTIGGDGCAGRIPGKETREKMSIFRKGKTFPERWYKSKACKLVLQYSIDGIFIKEFRSISEASRELDIPQQHIVDCCKGKKRKTRNFMWEFKSENNSIIKEMRPRKLFSKDTIENMRMARFGNTNTRGKHWKCKPFSEEHIQHLKEAWVRKKERLLKEKELLVSIPGR